MVDRGSLARVTETARVRALLSILLAAVIVFSATPASSAEFEFTPHRIAFSDVQYGIGSDDHAVATTDDGGAHWTVRSRISNVTLLRASGARAWLVAGQRVYASADRGDTWRLVGSSRIPLLGLFDSRTWWGAPAQSSGEPEAFRTGNGGASWQRIGARCSSDLFVGIGDLQFVSPDHGWALCGGCPATIMMCKTIAETTDGGRTWHENAGVSPYSRNHAGGLDLSGHPVGIFFLADGHGWYWEDRGYLWRTTDGGHAWHKLDLLQPDVSSVDSLSFVSDDVGFAMFREPNGAAYALIRTADGGVTWSSSRGVCTRNRHGYIDCPGVARA